MLKKQRTPLARVTQETTEGRFWNVRLVVAIATRKLAEQARISPGRPNEVGRSPCLGMGPWGVGRRTRKTPWDTH